jgi:presenilin-like A22 family membrane protease
MFLITQFIGLYVIHSDPFHITTKDASGQVIVAENPSLSWIQPPEVRQESDFGIYLGSVIFAFIFAIVLLFLLTKFKIDFILRGWFFLVVIIALFISFNAFFPKTIYFTIPLLLLAITLAFFKIFKRNFLLHNLTELLIYPGIAAVFVPILNFWTVLVLLLIISVYDIWAVWHSGIMQKMAKYQINNLKVFSGFFVPYISRKLRMKLRKLKKTKSKSMNLRKIKVNLAILGGGDVIFPIITAGVIFKTANITLPFGLPAFTGGLVPALFAVFGAALGLASLLLFSQKKKFYPAMPFITAGILLGMILSYIFLR